jgi:Ser/Thr protein kinase RdoA (MazF antagonist)
MNIFKDDPNQWGLIHGDLHYDNVLFDGNELRVIDFDGMISAPFAYDIGVTLYHIGYQGLPAREAIFAGYQNVRPLPGLPSGWIETCITWAAIDNLSFQVTIPTQQTNPLLKKNIHQLVYEFCAGLNRNQPPY